MPEHLPGRLKVQQGKEDFWLVDEHDRDVACIDPFERGTKEDKAIADRLAAA